LEKIKGNLNKIKKSAKAKVEKIKKYINKNIFIIISWSQFILTIVMTMLLICSLSTTTKLSKRIDDISKQNATIINSTTSQDSSESNTNVSSEVETKTESEIKSDEKTTSSNTSTTSSSTESTKTPSSNTSSTNTSTSTTKKPSTTSSSTTSTSTSTSTSTVNPNTETDLDLLACVIYQEAGGNGSCDDCRRRVADVVLNRVADPRFPSTIREVLTARNQYGKFYYTGVKWPSRATNVYEKDAVARAYRIAEEVLNGQHSDLYGNGYVWQAAFKQGSSQVYCCGEYFGK
jgi:spore germination cell wall hydrolase CwlJ-like protein